MKTIKTFAMMLALGLVGGLANAQSVTFDFDIDQSDVTDDVGPIIDFDFELGAVASIDSVEFELAHTFASDLILTLTGPNGEVFSFLDGATGGADDLGIVPDDPSLANVATYEFVESGGADFDTSGDGGFIAPGTFDALAWTSGPLDAGVYNITVADDFAGDDGSIGSITVNFTAVPEPATGLAIVGLCGLVACRRRR